MPSPFPGMNPWLEQPDAWSDFHNNFLMVARRMLAAQVTPRYFVKVDHHVYLHELPAQERRFLGRADLFVAPSGSAGSAPAAASGLVTASLRVQVMTAVDEERQAFLEIRDRESREVVTVVELLSPSNKYAGPHREVYLNKRAQVLHSRAHLVEVDLLRRGTGMPVTGLPACDYYALVSRAEDRPLGELWAWRLRDPLPVLPIPLRAPHPAVHLDLKAVLDRAFEDAHYGTTIYEGQPSPQLSPEEAAWAQAFLPTPQPEANG